MKSEEGRSKKDLVGRQGLFLERVMGNACDHRLTADKGNRGWRRGRKLPRIMSGKQLSGTARGFFYLWVRFPIYNKLIYC